MVRQVVSEFVELPTNHAAMRNPQIAEKSSPCGRNDSLHERNDISRGRNDIPPALCTLRIRAVFPHNYGKSELCA